MSQVPHFEVLMIQALYARPLAPALFAMALLSCTPFDAKKSAANDILFVKGDLNEFVTGRRLTKSSTIRLEQIDTSAKYQLSAQGFENVKNSGEPLLPRLETYEYKIEMGDSDSDFRLVPESGRGPSFKFQALTNRLELTAIEAKGRTWREVSGDYRLLNYSSSRKSGAHSLLLFAERGERQALIAYSLVKMARSTPLRRTTDAPFNYVLGRGVLTTWPAAEPLTVLFCASRKVPVDLYDDFRRQVEAWAGALAGRLEIRAELGPENCPPFSDLNTRTFNMLENWVEIPGHDNGIFGATTAVADLSRSEFFDGDVFFLTEELREVLNSRGEDFESAYFRRMFNHVALHEIGHLLGLGHTFDGPPSIMSYDPNVMGLQDYDLKAVQHLYPLLSRQ